MRVNLRIDAELWASVQVLAERDRRTVTSYVEEGLEGLLSRPVVPSERLDVERLQRAGEARLEDFEGFTSEGRPAIGQGAVSGALKSVYVESGPEPSTYRCRCPKEWDSDVLCPDCGYRAR